MKLWRKKTEDVPQQPPPNNYPLWNVVEGKTPEPVSEAKLEETRATLSQQYDQHLRKSNQRPIGIGFDSSVFQ